MNPQKGTTKGPLGIPSLQVDVASALENAEQSDFGGAQP